MGLVGIVTGRRIYYVVCSDHQGHIGFGEIGVDVFHFV